MDDAGAAAGRGRVRQMVGQTLRECREGFGEDLETLSIRTHIQVRYLKALEDGMYDVFPGEIWARLFLRGYAQELGLDADAMVAECFEGGQLSPTLTRTGSPGGRASKSDPPSPRGSEAGVPTSSLRSDAGTYEAQGERPERLFRQRRRDRRRGRGRMEAAPPVAGQGPGPEPGSTAESLEEAETVRAAGLTGWGSGEDLDDRMSGEAGQVSEPPRNATRGEARVAVPRRRVNLRSVRRAWASPGWAVVGSIGVAAFLTWLVVRLVSTGAVAGTLASVGTGTRAEKGGTAAAKTAPAVAVVRDSAGSATYAVRARRAALTLRFEGPCWVGLEVSGRSGYVLSQTYQAGEVLRLVRKPGFTLKLGAAWRAHGILNGRTVGPWTGGNVWDVTVMSETAGGRPSGGPKGA